MKLVFHTLTKNLRILVISLAVTTFTLNVPAHTTPRVSAPPRTETASSFELSGSPTVASEAVTSPQVPKPGPVAQNNTSTLPEASGKAAPAATPAPTATATPTDSTLSYVVCAPCATSTDCANSCTATAPTKPPVSSCSYCGTPFEPGRYRADVMCPMYCAQLAN